MRNKITRPKRSYHFDRLAEHVPTHMRGRPALAEHVLVQCLARTHPEEESAGHHRRTGRGRMCHDRRMDTQDGAGHSRPHP